jgi:deoxycytidylate deaminase
MSIKLPFGLKIARLSSFKSDCKFHIGAAWIGKSRLVSAWNKQKSSVAAKLDWNYYTAPWSTHAEFNLFAGQDESTIRGGTVYIYRQNSLGRLMLARPCNTCMKLLKSYGIKKVIYTIYDSWVTEFL